MGKDDDDILLLKIHKGDELAFRYLFERYFTPLCRFMNIYIHEKTDIEELALDIFIYIWNNRDTLQIQYSIKTYLFQAARNKCLNILRQRKLMASIDLTKVDIEEDNVISLETEELYLLIQEAVLTLPDRCRTIFQLSRNEDLSNHEIASKLDISIKTVEGQITKAIKIIKYFLDNSYSYVNSSFKNSDI
ncbi:MAG: RNA polymerase sigma-70 factor [Bacteroidales bacterium]|nr:RNA polymerase sigma-70 factor [Bacteroidales bacterium]MCK9312343.1 RNA polymerase sigma-70 factor [Bacteroidales bacterium]